MAEPSIGHDWVLYGDGKNSQTNWKRSKLLAKGGFGKVYLVESNEVGVRKVAAKQCNLNDDSDEREFGKIEWKILKELIHKRIVQYYGYSRTEHTLSLFIAYTEKGSLTNYIKQQQERCLTEEKTALFTYQILEGLVFLHSKNIIHRDIKGSNILLEDEDNVKLADFGLSKMLKNVSRATTAYVGTFNWMAPERFQKVVKYKSNVDVWSVGCTVFQMITGEKPFHKMDHEMFINSANNGLLNVAGPEYSSPLLKDFVRLACEIDPEKRPSAESLIKHTFVSGFELSDRVDEADIPDQQFDRIDSMMWKNPKKPIKTTDLDPGFELSDRVDEADILDQRFDGIDLNPNTVYHSSSEDINGPLGQSAGQDLPDESQEISKTKIREKLKANFGTLFQELQPNVLVEKLFENGIISHDDMCELGKKDRRESVTQLLDIVVHKEETVCAKFVDILNEAGYVHIYDKIINTTLATPINAQSGTLMDGMSDAYLMKVISESDAGKLSTIFGENWESVLLSLGLRKAEIDQVLESNGHKVQKTIMACLIKWKHNKKSEATLLNLIQVLKESERKSNAHIDWDRLKEVM